MPVPHFQLDSVSNAVALLRGRSVAFSRYLQPRHQFDADGDQHRPGEHHRREAQGFPARTAGEEAIHLGLVARFDGDLQRPLVATFRVILASRIKNSLI